MSSVFHATDGDPGNLFAALYDRWEHVANVNRVDEWRDRYFDDLTRAANEIRRTGLVPPWLVPSDEDAEAIYLALAAIDDALGDCHPRMGAAIPGPLVTMAARLEAIGSFSTAAVVGGVLPRWARPARAGAATDRLEDAFYFLVRVPSRHWHRVAGDRPSALTDLPSITGTRAAPLCFAFAPALRTLEDVQVDTGTGLPGLPDANWYALRPAPDRIVAQVDELLAAFDASDAQVAVLPEGALDQVVLSEWIQRVKSTPRPASSPLRWLVLGSGPASVTDDPRPSNTATVIHRDTGEVILRHSKFAPFNFVPGQLERWGLDGVIALAAPVHEGIYRGQVANYLESRAGRFAILICEDVTRHGEPVADAVAAIGPSVIVVPVFARVTRQYFWEEQAARRYTTLFGATVAVGNSTVVPDAERRAGLRDPADEDAFCLVARPSDDPGDPADAEIGSLKAGDQCCVLPSKAP